MEIREILYFNEKENEMKSEKTITLNLNEQEFTWLKNLMQNPMFVNDPEDEDARDKEMRRKFWVALGGK